MRLESLLAATGGRLLNTPFTDRFERVTLRAGKVERGTLFIANDPQEIAEALEKGAYGILGGPGLQVLDDEVAWVEVPSLADALPRLLRLWLVENPRTFHTVDVDTAHYLKQIAHDTKAVVLSGTFAAMSETILASRADQAIFCPDTLFLDRIGVLPSPFEAAPPEARILSATLFETSALIGGAYHERITVPPCRFGAFLEAWGILERLEARRTLSHLAFPPSFDPLFLDHADREAPFGTTDRVVILSEKAAPCPCLQALDTAAWLTRKLFFPSGIKLDCAIKSPVIRYEDTENLIRKVKEERCRHGYLFVAGMKRTSFLEALARYGPVAKDYTTKGLF